MVVAEVGQVKPTVTMLSTHKGMFYKIFKEGKWKKNM